jgi:23S rRNA pseudouridine1911/1915/1917 synthase
MIKKVFRIEEKEERLDKYLVKKLPQFSREFLKKLIKDEKIKVNARKAKFGQRLKEGDEVICEILENKKGEVLPEKRKDIQNLYEDKDILVIDKPAGLVVHPSETQKKNTLVNWLIWRYPEIKEVGEDPERPGIAHRLDKETSGALLVAKNQKAFESLKEQFATKEIKKEYLALLCGNLKKDRGVLINYLQRSKKDPTKIMVSKEGREAKLSYEVVERFKDFTLVRVYLETGRTHQIRVQFKNIGYPVAGDMKYGFRKAKNPKDLKRHFLHAQMITFLNLKGERITLKSPLSSELEKVLKNLREN